MEVIADLHLHSKYSRACSKDLNIKNMSHYAKIKGISLLGTGDFQHPKWQEELKRDLSEDGSGILRTKDNFPFLLTSEISLIYKHDNKGRKVHNVIWAKSLEVASQVSDVLLTKGRIDYDGRPIFGMSCPEFVELLKEVDKDIEIIPAHIWTPHFSMFGANSGFDSAKECFGDTLKHISAVETGLSSDPPMNWRISQLDKFNLVSFSDSHSFWPWRLGREATIFDVSELSYKSIVSSVRSGNGLKGTIEVDPNYGKYHFDGHRNCDVCLSPVESNKLNKLCPVCKRPLTIGVESRVEELADRPLGFKPSSAKPFEKLLPLSDLISFSVGKGVSTKSVSSVFDSLIDKFGSEFSVLRSVPKVELSKVLDSKLVDLIIRNRNQELNVSPGFDGVYGKIVDSSVDVSKPVISNFVSQKDLSDFF